MIRKLLEDFKIIGLEIIGVVGGLLSAIETKFHEHEPIIVLACSGLGLLISLILRFFPKEDKEEIKLKNTKDSFIFEFQEISKVIKEQSETFLNKSEELKDFSKQEFELEIISNLKGANSRIGQYNQQNLQMIFPNKLKHILNIFEYIRNVDLQISKCEKDLNKSFEKINNNKVQNTADINKIFGLIQKYASKTNGKIEPSDLFLFQIVTACNKHMEVASNYHILFGKESLIDPIRLQILNHSNDKRAIELLEIINMCDFRYREVEKEMNFLIESFKKLGLKFLQTSNNINQELGNLI